MKTNGPDRASLQVIIDSFRKSAAKHDLSPFNIYVEGVPFCLMPGLENHVNFKRTIATYFSQREKQQKLLMLDNHVRAAACPDCVYSTLCPGADPGLLNLQGESGIKAIKSISQNLITHFKSRGIFFPVHEAIVFHPAFGELPLDMLKLRVIAAELENKFRASTDNDTRYRTAFDIGEIFTRVGDTKSAIHWYGEAKKIFPAEGLPRLRLTRALWNEDRLEEADAELKGLASIKLDTECGNDMESMLKLMGTREISTHLSGAGAQPGAASDDSDNPLSISFDIELTNLCNCLCAMCPRDKMKRPPGLMEPETFYKIIDEIRGLAPRWKTREIWFTGFGEPLLHPKLIEFSSYIKKTTDVYLGITTNCTLLSDEMIEKIVSSGVDSITLSIHGLENIHERIVKNSTFSELLTQVRKLASAAAGRLNLGITAVETRLNKDHLRSGDFEAFWKAEGFESIAICPCHTRGGNFREISATGFPAANALEDCAIFQPIQFIASNGDMLACCSDIDGGTCIGSALTTTLQTLLMKKKEIGNPRRSFRQCRECPDNHAP
jgi:uncharacterized radical SAM superfamily Fe-S cluster-containing enzyme